MTSVALVPALAPSPLSFFFQAEDGIRDTSVTGVQTCALPISRSARNGRRGRRRCPRGRQAAGQRCVRRARSEERRVGKEWRGREGAEARNNLGGGGRRGGEKGKQDDGVEDMRGRRRQREEVHV